MIMMAVPQITAKKAIKEANFFQSRIGKHLGNVILSFPPLLAISH